MNKIPLFVENLRKKFPELVALHKLSFELKAGEIFGLLGPNGAGKTTFISMLTGLLDPTSGIAQIFGYNVLENSLHARRLVGVVPQEIVSHGFFSINEVLNFHSGYYGLHKNQKRIDYLLDRLSLEPHRNKQVAQLSGGMKRRLLIAKALVHSPLLLLLDEPTAGVDVELRNTLWEFVKELNEGGTTILLTTHYLQEAEELCNRIGVLDHGKLIALDDTSNLISNLTYRKVKIILNDKCEVAKNNNQQFKECHNLEVSENTLTFKIKSNETIGTLIKDLSIPLEAIQDIAITEGSLEDAFVSLLEKNKE
ncbi:MAG: ABC-2 type transport system ATP-binding protein [bacterium]